MRADSSRAFFFSTATSLASISTSFPIVAPASNAFKAAAVVAEETRDPFLVIRGFLALSSSDEGSDGLGEREWIYELGAELDCCLVLSDFFVGWCSGSLGSAIGSCSTTSIIGEKEFNPGLLSLGMPTVEPCKLLDTLGLLPVLGRLPLALLPEVVADVCEFLASTCLSTLSRAAWCCVLSNFLISWRARVDCKSLILRSLTRSSRLFRDILSVSEDMLSARSLAPGVSV